MPRFLHILMMLLFLAAHGWIASHGSVLLRGGGDTARQVVALLIDQPQILAGLMPTLLVAAGLYALFFCVIGLLAGPARTPGATRRVLLSWSASLWLLLHVHNTQFPNSVWAWGLRPLYSQPATPALDLAASIALLWLLIQRIRATDLRSPWRAAWRRASLTSVVLVTAMLVCGGWTVWTLTRAPADAARSPRPHLIVIGIDSLRRDIALGIAEPAMPNVAALRKAAFMQSNVVSPLARTFPAWVSMLTGLAPYEHGARTNHAPPAGIASDRSIAWQLKEQGYRTVYAIDETRFSNIGPEFGFDTRVQPTPGAADFILGQIADQPLINFAVQIPGAEWLLPTLVGNRAFAQAYRPVRFIARLTAALPDADERPLALFVHLCLAHWPYVSADTPATAGGGMSTLYAQSVKEVDAQLGVLLHALEQRGYTPANSVFVLLADHGEALSPHEFVPAAITKLGTDAQPPLAGAGHGASLLNPQQWQVFAMFWGHSALGRIPHGDSAVLASLQDLPATLLRLAGVPETGPGVPMSIATVLQPQRANSARQSVLMETGFRPGSIHVENPDATQALHVGLETYDFGSSGRLMMKPEVYAATIASKDVGITDGTSILAVVHRPIGSLLVTVDPARRWTLYPAGRRSTPDTPHLLDTACEEPEIRARLSAWCD